MSIKKALLCTFTIGVISVLAAWLIGHLWVFIFLVTVAFIGIAWGISNDAKQAGDNKTGNESDSTD